MACCPAHEDRTPSLTLREKNGKVLIRCHAGCSQDDVLAALRSLGVWYERRHAPGSPGEPADAGRAEDMIRAACWAQSVTVLAEWLLEDIPLTDQARIPLTNLLRVIGLGDEALLAEYRSWRESHPKWTAGLVHAGRLNHAQLERALARWIQEGMHGEYEP